MPLKLHANNKSVWSCLHCALCRLVLVSHSVVLTLHEHEHPHAEADACGAYWRDMMLHSVILVMATGSSPLPWRARRACDERRVLRGICGGAVVARGRGVGHSHGEAAGYLGDIEWIGYIQQCTLYRLGHDQGDKAQG